MRRGASGLFAGAVAAALLLLVWAAAAGPVGILSPSGRTRTFRPPPEPTSTPDASGGKTLAEATEDVRQTLDLAWLGQLVIWAILLGVLTLAFLAGRHAWRHRWRPPPKPAEVEFDVLPETAVGDALREDAGAQLAAVEQGSPRNGIVACWLRVEEAVAAAGLPRSPWETSAEFTVRILHALDIDPRAIGTLSQLYREARFSEHELGEEARTAAASALRHLHADLQVLGVNGDSSKVAR